MTEIDERKVLTITTFERHGPRVVNPDPPQPVLDDNNEQVVDEDGNPQFTFPPEIDPDDDGPEQWHWHTQAMNGEIIGDGSEGYSRLSDAVHGFLTQQGVNPDHATLSDPYSKLEKVNENVYQIRKFAPQDEETE